MTLSDDERAHLPGWLTELLDGDDVRRIENAAMYCSTRYYIHLLSARAKELRGD